MPTLARSDVTLAYSVSGDGRPVLLIQGVGAGGGGWGPQVDGLSGEFRLLTFDNRGFGRSAPCRGPISIEAMADDVAALLDAVGWESAHLVGHSMGGVVAQQVALDHPRRVRSLSLLCTFGRAKDGARLTPWVLWMTLRTRLGSRPSRRRAFLEMLFPAGYQPAEGEEALAARVAGLIGRDLADQPPIVMQQVRALSRHDASDRLGRLAGIPALVISGELDPIARPAYGRMLAERIPGAAFEVWPGTAHGLMLQQPEAVNDRLRRFFAEAETGTAARGTPGGR